MALNLQGPWGEVGMLCRCVHLGGAPAGHWDLATIGPLGKWEGPPEWIQGQGSKPHKGAHTHTVLAFWSGRSYLDHPESGLPCGKEGFLDRMEEALNVPDSSVSGKSRCRQRTVWEGWQKEALLRAFSKNPYPSFRARQELANQFGVPEPRIRVWFQNHRNRSRLVNQGPRATEDPSVSRSPEPGARAAGRSTTTEGRTRLRTRLSSAQLTLLMEAFERDPKPQYAARVQLAQMAGLPEDTIQIWFQNRRARCPSKPRRILLSGGGGRGRVPSQDLPPSTEFNEKPQGLHGRMLERAQDSSSSQADAETMDIHPLTLSCPLTSSRFTLPAAAQHSGPNQDDPEPQSDAGNIDPVSDLFLDQILEDLQVDLHTKDTLAPHDQWEQIEPSLQAPLDPEEYQALLDLL